MQTKEEIRYEDNAHTVTVTGWACKKCSRWWGKDEHMARYCCATSFPCECGGRVGKYYTHCDECRRKKEHERWYAKPEVVWDGNYPIACWNSDKYFFNEEELMDYLAYCDDDYLYIDDEPSKSDCELIAKLNELRLTTCSPNVGRDFCMSEYLCDDMPEDGEIDDEEINKAVNEWITKHAPFSWSMTGERLSIESVKTRIS